MRTSHWSIILTTCLLTAGCANRGSKAPPAAAAVPRTYDIPYLPALKVSGNGANWGERGMRIDAMTELWPHPPADACHPPAARLGWTDEGLAFLFFVHDDTPIESEDDDLWKGDSIEVFVSSLSAPAQQIRLAVAPGMDPAQKLRWKIEYLPENKPLPVDLKLAVTAAKAADGYVVEGVLPFSLLNMAAKPGTEIGVGLTVHDRTSLRGMARYQWGATRGRNR